MKREAGRNVTVTSKQLLRVSPDFNRPNESAGKWNDIPAHTHTHSPLCYLLKITKYSVWALPLPQAGHTTHSSWQTVVIVWKILDKSRQTTPLWILPQFVLSLPISVLHLSLSLFHFLPLRRFYVLLKDTSAAVAYGIKNTGNSDESEHIKVILRLQLSSHRVPLNTHDQQLAASNL